MGTTDRIHYKQALYYTKVTSSSKQESTCFGYSIEKVWFFCLQCKELARLKSAEPHILINESVGYPNNLVKPPSTLGDIIGFAVG